MSERQEPYQLDRPPTKSLWNLFTCESLQKSPSDDQTSEKCSIKTEFFTVVPELFNMAQ